MTKRKLTADDIFAIELVGDNARHPTKPKAAVVTQHLSQKENKYQSHIWMVSTEDGSKRRFTNGQKSETAPAWSPDGRFLGFLSNREGDDMQLYLIPEAGGEAVQVTNAKDGVESFRWSPDGTTIGFIAKVVPGEPASEQGQGSSGRKSESANNGASGGSASLEPAGREHNERDESPREKYTKDVLHIRRSFYRLDGVGFFGDKRTHLFTVDVSALVDDTRDLRLPDEADGLGEVFPVRQVTGGEFDIDSYDFSPDGRMLVVATNVNEDAEQTFQQLLYAVELDASGGAPVPVGAMTCLTPDFQTAAKPRYSSDGQYIAFKGENHEFGPTTLTGLYMLEVKSGTVTHLTKGTDEIFENRSIADTRTGTRDELQWSADNQYLYTEVSRRGTTQLARVTVASGEVQYLTEGNHCVLSYSMSKDDKEVVLTMGTALDVANIYARRLADAPGSERKLTDWNREFLESVELSVPERFEFENDGLTLDGWVMLPSTEAPAGGYPTVLEVHGGPAMMYSESFFFEFQLLAAQGMAVIYCNPRGSVGYGQEFASCIEMDWGNLDFKDVEKLADTALDRYPLNPNKMSIAGGSYGGFMSAWAIGHTKRYKAAVVMRAVINWYSMMASDIGYVSPAQEFDGKAPWEDIERYMRISPITYVNQVETSTLIIHSENDYRCPIDQGEQFYIALRLRGVPVEFLRFPDESHGLSRNGKPWHRVLRLEKMSSFLKRELEV